MTQRGFVITFPACEPEGPGIDRIRNWAEDLFRHITRKGLGNVEDPNRSTDKVWVVAATPRATGDLVTAIRRSLKQHNLEGSARVSKLADPGAWAEYETFRALGGVRRRLTTR